MPAYVRNEPADFSTVDDWKDGIGWIAHPNEDTLRTSHAVRGDDGVWILDPLDAPGVAELVAELGDVVGVAVLSNYHSRDASAFANRFDVPVYLPEWMSRVESRIDARVERYAEELGDSGFEVEGCRPLPGWREGIAYRESDGTLYVPDVMGTAPVFTVGDERIGIHTFVRPRGGVEPLTNVEPSRILVGHGTGIFEDSTAALSDAHSGVRRSFPKALSENAGDQIRSLLGALLDREC